MKLRTLLIVIALLLAVSGLALVFKRPATSAAQADPRVSRAIVAPDLVEKTTRLRLSDQGKTLLLAKTDGTWRVTSYHGLPADFDKLARLVNDLTAVKIERLVTTNPARLARLEFAETQISLLDDAEKPLTRLTLGKTADGGGRFLRFDDEPKAYLARLNTTLDLEPRNWADTTLTRFTATDVAKIAFVLPDGTSFTASRAKKEDAFAADHVPAGKQLKTPAITALLGTLGSLRFTETTPVDDPKASGARAHARTVTVTTFDGKTFTLSLGREPERTQVKTDALKPDASLQAAVLADATRPGTAATEKSGPAAVVGNITEKVPAGPVFAFVTHSDSGAPINALMKQRAFQVGDYSLTGLPQKADDLFEPIPPPPAAK